MENCLFDRIGKREEVKNFLNSPHKNRLMIRYNDSRDCPEHFRAWIKEFIMENYTEDFEPIQIKIDPKLNLFSDPYQAINDALGAKNEFLSYCQLFTSFSTREKTDVDKIVNKKINPDKPAQAVTDVVQRVIKTVTNQKKYQPEKELELKRAFWNSLKKCPKIIFLIQIDSRFEYILNKYLKLIPQDNAILNKFIFIVKKLNNNEKELSIEKIQKEHVTTYLEKNRAKNKLNLDDRKIQRFTSSIRFPAKYSTIRSKAVKELNFEEIKNCNKTTNF